MRSTLYLFQHTALVTLFTRANCSLCEDAKIVLATLDKKRSFEYNQVDVMDLGQKKWKDLYEFDTPVVHVERVFHTYSKPNITTEARKLMHRFTKEQVEELIGQAEGHS